MYLNIFDLIVLMFYFKFIYAHEQKYTHTRSFDNILIELIHQEKKKFEKNFRQKKSTKKNIDVLFHLLK
jgi:hypothetical protein